MFRYEPETNTLSACCDVCENPLSDDEQRLIYRTDRSHRCAVIHAECVEKAYGKLLLTDEEVQRWTEGHPPPVVPFMMLKMTYARTFETDRAGRFGQ